MTSLNDVRIVTSEELVLASRKVITFLKDCDIVMMVSSTVKKDSVTFLKFSVIEMMFSDMVMMSSDIEMIVSVTGMMVSVTVLKNRDVACRGDEDRHWSNQHIFQVQKFTNILSFCD